MTACTQVKERPIPMTAESVRRILEGRKTQTRRVLLDSTEHKGPYSTAYIEQWKDSDGWKTICPYGRVGERLWVKEAVVTHASIHQVVGYVADGCKRTEQWEKLRNVRYMPRWASRITLELTDVRVQRVQEITTEDAIAEGCGYVFTDSDRVHIPRINFSCVWDAINAKRGFGWAANPWVWVVSFKRVQS